MKNKSLNAKVAVITGGSKGIGFRIAKIFAKKKYNIVICSRSKKDTLKAKKEIESFGVKCLGFKTDISKYAACKSLISNAIKTFARIDLLVNNAGIQGPIGNLWENNLKEWEKTIQINLLGTFYMCKLVIPQMLKQGSGKIINLSGGGGAYARPLFSAYGAGKTAILRLSETLAEELKNTDITVHALAPGTVWTNMAKETMKNKAKLDKKTILELELAKKTGGASPEKLEAMLSFLTSNKSNKLSGKLIHVNELEKIKKKSNIKTESGLLRRVDFSRSRV